MHALLCAHLCTNTHTHTYTLSPTYARTPNTLSHTYIHMHAHIQTYTNAYTHIHHIYTNIHGDSLSLVTVTKTNAYCIIHYVEIMIYVKINSTARWSECDVQVYWARKCCACMSTNSDNGSCDVCMRVLRAIACGECDEMKAQCYSNFVLCVYGGAHIINYLFYWQSYQ